MGNCIISKLGGSVSNDELLQLGDVRLNVTSMADAGYATDPQAHTFLLRFFSLEDSPSMEIVGDGYFTDSTMSQNLGKSITIASTSDTYFYVSDGDYSIIIHTHYHLRRMLIKGVSNMYTGISLDCDTIRCKIDDTSTENNRRFDIYTLNALSGNLKNFLQNNLTNFIFYRYKGSAFNINWFADPQLRCKDTLVQFDTSGTICIGELSSMNNLPALSIMTFNLEAGQQDPSTNTITGDLADFNPIGEHSRFTAISIRSAALVTGDISSLSKFYNLGTLNLSNTAQLTGRLESFLDAVHAYGRTSGTMTINISGTAITYNNAPLSAQKTVTFSASGWTLA